MVSFIDCHLSLRRCSPFNGGKFEGWGTSFCWWPNRIGYLDELSEQAAKLFFDQKHIGARHLVLNCKRKMNKK